MFLHFPLFCVLCSCLPFILASLSLLCNFYESLGHIPFNFLCFFDTVSQLLMIAVVNRCIQVYNILCPY